MLIEIYKIRTFKGHLYLGNKFNFISEFYKEELLAVVYTKNQEVS